MSKSIYDLASDLADELDTAISELQDLMDKYIKEDEDYDTSDLERIIEMLRETKRGLW